MKPKEVSCSVLLTVDDPGKATYTLDVESVELEGRLNALALVLWVLERRKAVSARDEPAVSSGVDHDANISDLYSVVGEDLSQGGVVEPVRQVAKLGEADGARLTVQRERRGRMGRRGGGLQSGCASSSDGRGERGEREGVRGR